MSDITNSQNIHIEGSNVSLQNVSNTVISPSETEDEIVSFLQLILKLASNESVKEEIKALEKEILKGNQANETVIRKRLETIWELAPDIWEVITNTVENPLKGISTVVLKILERARQEKGKQTG